MSERRPPFGAVAGKDGRITLIGSVGVAPELHNDFGESWLNLAIAAGEKPDGSPAYWQVRVRGELAEAVARDLHPGDRVVVVGYPRPRKDSARARFLTALDVSLDSRGKGSAT